jgi:hypothetical protein
MSMEIIDAKDVRQHKVKVRRIIRSDEYDIITKDDENDGIIRNPPLVNEKDIRVRGGGRSGIGVIDEFRYLKSPNFDIHCSIYLNFVQRYIRQILGAYRKGKYWIMNIEGRGGLKVKHISACLRTTYNEYAWYYPIKFDDKADAFLLSAFSDRITMEPMHLWFIHKSVVLHIGDMQKPIWNRERLVVNERMISKLRAFEMHDNLLVLIDIMKKVSLAESEKNNTDLRRRLIIRQHDILKRTGYNFRLDFLIHQAVHTGLADIEKLYGIDECSELMGYTTLNVFKELEYVRNKEELDNELIDSLKNISVAIDVRTVKLLETAMSIGIDKLNIEIIMDMIKIEEFIKTNKEYHGSRHVGSWKGRKDYIKGMNPIIREGLSTILRSFYLDMMR